MQKSEFFAYSWHIDEEQTEVTLIRVYGINNKNENVCVIISNFLPYTYLQLPENIDWDESKAGLVITKLNTLLRDKRPVEYQLVFKKKLYYATTGNKLHPYLKCSCSNTEDIRQLGFKIRRPLYVSGLGELQIKMHEHNANPILQLTSQQKLPTAGWIRFAGKKIPKDDQTTHCTHEYKVQWQNMIEKQSTTTARPLLMGYDIEVNSSNPSAMPKAIKPEDKIFQVSCVFARQGSKPTNWERHLLTLGKPDPSLLENVTIHTYDTESDILIGFVDLIQEKQPNIIIGYNIFTFDIPYMIQRSKNEYCFEFDKQGMNKDARAKERTIEWSSSAYKNQSFQFLDAEGRIFVDLLPLVKRDYKMNNYQLKTISAYFLKDMTKDPLDAKAIFKCYRLGMKGGSKGAKALGIVGKYCVKDSELVVRLFETLTTWFALCEMSKVTNVPIFQLYTQGQQLKVFSQAYKKCTHENTVVEKDGYITKENDYYVGATVFPPIPGVYDKVVPFDFSSLYPTTIIAYNISWDTFVDDENIPDSMCHVMEWPEHIGCCHDPKVIRVNELNEIIAKMTDELKLVRKERDLKKNKNKKHEYMEKIAEINKKISPYRLERSSLKKSKPKHIICAQRRYRWLKQPMGVLPEILTHLLDTRKATKNEMKTVKSKLKELKEGTPEHDELSTYHDVLDQRQLALKVSANSGYGSMGVKRGYLPLIPGAACTTYMGRKAIEKAADSIQKDWKGVLVYGDSVTKDTPILIRYPDESINIRKIETLAPEWTDYDQFKPTDNGHSKEQGFIEAETWTNGKWSKIKRIIRHRTEKQIYRINTPNSTVDVTEDHSMLTPNLTQIKPETLRFGDQLLQSFPTSLPEFETKMLEGTTDHKTLQCTNKSTLTKEEAFVWGFFMSNGTCNKTDEWYINHENLQLLKQIRNLLEFIEDCTFEIIIGDSPILTPSHIHRHEITIKYHQIMYDEDSKIVPYPILNATRDIQIKFLEGYCTGNDPTKISCRGKIGAQGLYLLFKMTGNENIILGTSDIDKDLFTLSIQEKDIGGKNQTSRVRCIGKANDWVYDIETEEGIFHAGIGELIVKNTDSNYVNFPHLETAAECWDYSIKVAKEVSKLFPKPMSLAYEEKVYWRFFILTKKRYMSLACERDGVVENKISKKGVLLQRRDNCQFVRRVYEGVVMKIFHKVNISEVIDFIIDELNKICSRFYPPQDFIVTKSIGDIGDLTPREGKDKNDKPCWKVGDYKVKLLPSDPTNREKQFKLKECTTEEEYYLRCLPAQVQLAEKMRSRGQLVAAGSRLEYIITNTGGHMAKQSVKVESADYFMKHSRSLEIDYMYYIKQLVNPIDEVLDIMVPKSQQDGCKIQKGFMSSQYKFRLKTRGAMLNEIKKLSAPKIRFLEK